MNGRQSKLVLSCLAALAPSMLAVGALPARAEPAAASSAQIDSLIQDIKAHKQMCDKVDPSNADQAKQCANEHNGLVARQKRLGISDETLNGKLKTRGWRWP